MQSSCPPAVSGPLPPVYQIPEMARLPNVAFPPTMMPQQEGPVAQTIVPTYHPFPASVGKYPTPPSQHSLRLLKCCGVNPQSWRSPPG